LYIFTRFLLARLIFSLVRERGFVAMAVAGNVSTSRAGYVG
jgi:hypothetical protein